LIPSAQTAIPLVPTTCRPRSRKEAETLNHMRNPAVNRARKKLMDGELNRANRRTKSFSSIQTKLLAIGPLCPIDIPHLEEIHFAASKGLGVADLTKAVSRETFDGLWSFIAREAGL